MIGSHTNPAINLSTAYSPSAIYYEDADAVEYVREDRPCSYRRIDEFLTLICDLEHRDQLIGFRLKGFRQFYEAHLHHSGDFVSLVGALERALTDSANKVFEERERERTDAYNRAKIIALDDRVALRGWKAHA